MSHTPSDILDLLKQIRYEATAIQAKVTEAMQAIAALNLPDPERKPCPTCGLGFLSTTKLSEHVYHSHGGPEPAHWKEEAA